MTNGQLGRFLRLFMIKFHSYLKIPCSSPPAGGGRAYNTNMYVYALYNREKKKVYIGQTKNLEERLNAHNDKRFSNSYTAKNDGYWELIYKEEIQTRKQALIREKQLKSYRGREFIKKLIIPL